MSGENVEVVRRMYDAFHRGDADGALSCFAPDIVVDASRRVDGGIGHGREDLNRIINRWLGAWEDWHEEIEELRDLGDRVFVAATQHGRGKGSGLEVENSYALLYEVEGGQITRMTVYVDAAEALAAAEVTG